METLETVATSVTTSVEASAIRLETWAAELPTGSLEDLALPDPTDEALPEPEFEQQVERAWQVCDRFDLQTEIWRGRILRVVRDREKQRGDGRGSGFLNWLKDREISKSRAYALLELADRADSLMQSQELEPETVDRFSKRAFLETAQAPPPVQQMVVEAAQQGQRITRRQVRDLTDEWTAATSELIPAPIRAKAAEQSIPSRYLTPLVRELEKLPGSHQQALQAEIALNPDVDTLKQATADARFLARYLQSAAQVQVLQEQEGLDLEGALEEALRLGLLNLTADLVNQAAQLEQTLARLFTTWKRLGSLAEKLDGHIGASTPHLRRLCRSIEQHLSGSTIQTGLGRGAEALRLQVALQVLAGEEEADFQGS
ncbi:hypothetical protein [Thermostichus vulcanus]|uniref:hypothetical protein n=1 Tax=Thermostichus vulcanus TaxID=32053 RepID=UPI001FCAB70A|nr:hypothetical protein [Thermostichus vulcanus]